MKRDLYLNSEIRARYGPKGVEQVDPKSFEETYADELDFKEAQCPAFNALVVINRGYSIFSLRKDIESGVLRCPCCRTSRNLEIRNCGFVNCEWNMRGILRRNKESKINAEGRTYDGKLYTFKECDYTKVWYTLDVLAKNLNPTSV